MAFGIHWEWRGFGAVSAAFAARYARLEPVFPAQRVDDTYLWIPDLLVNAKLRLGGEEGLKIKRLRRSEPPFEIWDEREDDLYTFPLSDRALSALAGMLSKAGLELGRISSIPANRDSVLKHLERSGCKLVTVSKIRESRLCEGSTGDVLVEWAVILEPQPVVSIGLENRQGEAEEPVDASDEDMRKSLREVAAAVDVLGLGGEPLTVMSYLDAVSVWARNEWIGA
jgi:hypothetical protein